MWGKILGIIIAAFLLGWTTHILVSEAQTLPLEQPQALSPFTPVTTFEKPSPADFVREEDIDVLSDRVVIRLDNPQWSIFTDTNSMDPVLDETSHAIQRVPADITDIHVGDVISYVPQGMDATVIHRVIEIGNDGAWYARVKGDNNPYADPQPVRFNQIKRVLVAVIY